MTDYSCTFCGKPRHEVKKIIAGPNVNICNECVDLCKEVTEEQKIMSEEGIEGMSESMYRTFLAEQEKKRTDAYIKQLENDLDSRESDRKRSHEDWLKHVKKIETFNLVQTIAFLSFLVILITYLKDVL